MPRQSIIESVKTPLGFFVLVMLILEAGLLGSMAFTPKDLHDDTLYIFSGLAVVVILSVLYISKDTNDGVEALGYSLGTEIYYAFDPYISNLPDNEREEAYQSLLSQMKAPSDTQNQEIRRKIAEVIKEKAGITN